MHLSLTVLEPELEIEEADLHCVRATGLPSLVLSMLTDSDSPKISGRILSQPYLEMPGIQLGTLYLQELWHFHKLDGELRANALLGTIKRQIQFPETFKYGASAR